MATILACPALTVAVPANATLGERFLAGVTEGWQASAATPEATIALRQGEPAVPPATGAPIAYGDLAGRASDDGLWLTTGTASLVVDYRRCTATITLAADVEPELAFCRDTLWRLAVIELCRTVGRFYLHAAAIVVHGAVWLVCAEGGTGKSTFAAAARRSGSAVLTDDAAILHAGRTLTVSALPAAWRVSGPAAGWLGLSPSTDKQRLPVPGPLGPLPVAAVCLAERGGQSACLSMAAAEALPRLVRQNPLIMTSRFLAGPHLAALSRLVESVSCKRLVLGPDLLSDPSSVLELLSV